MKNKWCKTVITILLCISAPVFVGCLVRISVVDWLQTDNDWIGFWGGYLGGMCTLLGVLISIRSLKNDSDEKQRLSVIPYISVDHHSSIDIDEREIPIGLIYAFNESIDDNFLFFKEVKVIGKCKSVGLGPAINCKITDIKIEKREIDSNTGRVGVICVNSESYFLVKLYSIKLCPEQLEKENVKYIRQFWSTSRGPGQPPEICVEFYFSFEDVLGNKYKQKVVFYGQLDMRQAEGQDCLNTLFKNIDKPELL